jgi:hypothetical protein
MSEKHDQRKQKRKPSWEAVAVQNSHRHE